MQTRAEEGTVVEHEALCGCRLLVSRSSRRRWSRHGWTHDVHVLHVPALACKDPEHPSGFDFGHGYRIVARGAEA